MNAVFLSLLLIPGADSVTPKSIAVLIEQLGHDDFDMREQAQQALLRSGWSAAPLLRKAHDHPDPEIRTRARLALWYLRDAELKRLGPFPMIDALWLDPATCDYDAERPNGLLYRHYLEEADAPYGYPFTRYRMATRNLVADWLEQGVSPLKIRLTLARMHLLDTLWMRDVARRNYECRDSMKGVAVFPWQVWVLPVPIMAPVLEPEP